MTRIVDVAQDRGMQTSTHPIESAEPSTRIVPSFCRNCLASCPILVTVENGRATKVTGNPQAPAYDGYTCPKGRDLPAQHNAPDRLLHCLARKEGGRREPMESSRLLDEVSGRLQALVSRYGPRSVAVFYGTGNVTNPAGSAMARAWANALGTDLVFSAMAIDKPAANTSIAMHGHWHAGAQSFESSDTWIIVGANPVIAKSNGVPVNNPGQRLKEAVERGMKLIVVDPRRTETARRAHVHLQSLPGEDSTLLAGLIHIILAEGLHDPGFIAQNADGFDALSAAVAPYTPDHVASRAGVPRELLLEAARTFGKGRRGGVICSTGPSFATHSNLAFYLGLCLNTLCGRWAREGEIAPYPNVLLPAFQPRAQPYAPYSVFGKGRMRAHGLRESAAGMPTAALADEILLGGDGGIKALICLGGNPVLSWPNQHRTEEALKSLDLLVVLDTRMTATAELADYVVAAPLSLETAGSTSRVEALKYVGVARGFSIPWAQYTPKVVEPPPGSDLVEDAAFFFRLAQRMGLQLTWTNAAGYRSHVESPPASFRLDMAREPSNEELIELTCSGSRVPLEEVKKYPHGHVFDDVAVTVAPRDPACTARLQLADPMMMRELAQLHNEAPGARPSPDQAYLLTSRRINKVMNSVGHHVARGVEGSGCTPAFLHSSDLSQLGASEGEIVNVTSSHGAIQVRLHADDTVRLGTVSVVHGFGTGLASEVKDGAGKGCSVTCLTAMTEVDPISGIPRSSALPVSITRVAQ
jgi:anaerobic selenocysteine-containing dehydrogenase